MSARYIPAWARELLREPGTLAHLEWRESEALSTTGERYPIEQGIPIFADYVGSYQNKPGTEWPVVDRHNPSVKAFQDRETIFDRFAECLRGKVVVDMCSGGGMPAYYLAACYDCRVIAIERAWHVLKHYGDRFKAFYGVNGEQAVRICADALQLPLRNEAASVVVGSSWMHHFADKATMLRNAYRVLIPGGLLLAHNEGVGALLTRGTSNEDQYVSTRMYHQALTSAGFVKVQVLGASKWYRLARWLKASVDLVGYRPEGHDL
jgi:ubiquinone/menaquinone biosynthesis C-methylase UbiE